MLAGASEEPSLISHTHTVWLKLQVPLDLQNYYIAARDPPPARAEFIFLRLLLICIDIENISEWFVYILSAPHQGRPAVLGVRVRDTQSWRNLGLEITAVTPSWSGQHYC